MDSLTVYFHNHTFTITEPSIIEGASSSAASSSASEASVPSPTRLIAVADIIALCVDKIHENNIHTVSVVTTPDETREATIITLPADLENNDLVVTVGRRALKHDVMINMKTHATVLVNLVPKRTVATMFLADSVSSSPSPTTPSPSPRSTPRSPLARFPRFVDLAAPAPATTEASAPAPATTEAFPSATTEASSLAARFFTKK